MLLSKADANRVDALDQWCLRRIFNIQWYQSVSICEVQWITDQPSLTSVSQKRHLVLFSHLVRMYESADGRRILNLQFPRVIGKGQQDVLTPPGSPQWRMTYHSTTSVWKMPPSRHWTDHGRLLAASRAMHWNDASRTMMMMMMIAVMHLMCGVISDDHFVADLLLSVLVQEHFMRIWWSVTETWWLNEMVQAECWWWCWWW